MAARVAIVDDEPIVCSRLQRALAKDGHDVECFAEGNSLLRRMQDRPFDIVFTDLRMPGIDGMEVLGRIKAEHEGSEVIIITGHSSIDGAIEAVQHGAFHYVAKPLRLEEIRHLATRAEEKITLRRENNGSGMN